MNIFDAQLIYRTIFFNIQSVTEYGDLNDFIDNDHDKYLTWEAMSKKRYASEIEEGISLNTLYLEKACFLPEFSKIVAISYALPKTGEDGGVSRDLKRIEGDTEIELIKSFSDVLDGAYTEGHNARPSFMPVLCGHNVIGHDIPLFIKRIVKHRVELGYKDGLHTIPQILKHHLSCKPWESNVLDTINVWKLNGSDYISLNLVSDFIDLKKTTKLSSMEEINKLYWTGIEDDSGSTMAEIKLQSANFTNVAFQFVRELRQM